MFGRKKNQHEHMYLEVRDKREVTDKFAKFTFRCYCGDIYEKFTTLEEGFDYSTRSLRSWD